MIEEGCQLMEFDVGRKPGGREGDPPAATLGRRGPKTQRPSPPFPWALKVLRALGVGTGVHEKKERKERKPKGLGFSSFSSRG